jgi:hypothetical protein
MRVARPSKTPPVEQGCQVILVQRAFGLGERQLQRDDAADELGAATAAKQGGQHDLAVRTDEPSP